MRYQHSTPPLLPTSKWYSSNKQRFVGEQQWSAWFTQNWSQQRGSATAEFVAVMPAVALILAICLAAIQAVVVQVQLADAAAIGARSLARGDGLALAESLTRSAVPSSSFAEERMGDIVCVRVGAQPGTMLLMGIQLSVRSCALGAPP